MAYVDEQAYSLPFDFPVALIVLLSSQVVFLLLLHLFVHVLVVGCVYLCGCELPSVLGLVAKPACRFLPLEGLFFPLLCFLLVQECLHMQN